MNAAQRQSGSHRQRWRWGASVLSLVVFQALAEASTVGDATLRPSLERHWVAYALPVAWQRKYAPEFPGRGAYIVLESPSPKDLLGNDFPCEPPTRVAVIAGQIGHEVARRVFEADFCNSEWTPPASLSWAKGPRMHPQSLEVTLRADGSLLLRVRVVMNAEPGKPGSAHSGVIEHRISRNEMLGILRAAH